MMQRDFRGTFPLGFLVRRCVADDLNPRFLRFAGCGPSAADSAVDGHARCHHLPEWQFRYYSFNAKWSPGEQMGSMRDGSGDNLFALFNAAGCWLKGFAHEAPMSPYRDDGTKRLWPGIVDSVPPEFGDCLREPAFNVADTTFCIWRQYHDSTWQKGEIEYPPNHRDPDGSIVLLSLLGGEPETYRAWAENYYERTVSSDAVRRVYEHQILTVELVALLNPEVSLADLKAEIIEIGYPIASCTV